MPTMTDASPDILRAAIYGHLVGDAIGVPYEFTAPDERRVVELRGHGSHDQPPGTWSDDGALMLALLDSLVSVGFDPEDQGRRALVWADARGYTPDGDGIFDIGGATSAALHRLRSGTRRSKQAEPRTRPGQRQPHADPARRAHRCARGRRRAVQRAHHASRVTHGHPNCEVACALYVLVARTLLEHPGDDREAALALAADRLRAVYERDAAFAAVLGALLAHRSHVNKPGGGWVLDSFWSAWEAFATSGSYRETIERCIRYGHDTDTTAAIAGGLAGSAGG